MSYTSRCTGCGEHFQGDEHYCEVRKLRAEVDDLRALIECMGEAKTGEVALVNKLNALRAEVERLRAELTKANGQFVQAINEADAERARREAAERVVEVLRLPMLDPEVHRKRVTAALEAYGAARERAEDDKEPGR